MKKRLVIILMLTTVLVGLALQPSLVFSQKQDIKAQLFENSALLLQKAREAQAQILAPISYEQGLEKQKEALRDYEKGKTLDEIRVRIKQAETYFAEALKTTEINKIIFARSLAARTDAGEADAPKFAASDWNLAESKLLEGTRKAERGDQNDAKKLAAESETLYRQAELQAIKTNYLQTTWELLDQADKSDVKKKAPYSLLRAKELAERSENILNTDRYNTDEARQLAQEAKKEVEHAFWLTDNIKVLEKNKTSLEELLIAMETNLKPIVGKLDLSPNFSRGPKPTIDMIVNKIDELQKQIESQKREIAEKDDQVNALMSEIQVIESKLGTLSSEKKAYEAKLEQQRIEREKFIRIENIFTAQEAQVLREGNTLIIRLWGLNFPSGKSVLQPEHYGLLSKLRDAIQEYPNAEVEIQGHTDARGSDELNQRLSTDRALSVKEYLVANGIVKESRVVAMGYGETMPIATNETEMGRTKNRRTDIIIRETGRPSNF